MRPAARRGLAIVAFVLLAMGMGAPTAFAQVPTPPNIPPLPIVTPPPGTEPVFELVAPTVFPWCGTAALVVFLARQSADTDLKQTLLDQGIPPEVVEAVPPAVYDYPKGLQIVTATTPIFAICGAVPEPPAQLTCLIDLQGQAAVSTAAAQIGVPLPLGLHPVGDTVEQTILIEDKLPPPANANNLGKTVASFLVCAAAAGPAVPGDFSSVPQPPPFSSPPFNPVTYPPGTTPGFIAQPPAQLPPALPGTTPGTTPIGDAVTYAAVWLVPLALLIYGGYFGGALTRELKLPAG